MKRKTIILIVAFLSALTSFAQNSIPAHFDECVDLVAATNEHFERKKTGFTLDMRKVCIFAMLQKTYPNECFNADKTVFCIA